MKNSTTHVMVIMFLIDCVRGAMEGFIVGGDETEMSQYPHSAFLDARCQEAGHWICGASILNQRLLLTAAHCVDECNWREDQTSRLITLVGHENLQMVSIKRKIVDVRMHPDFNGITMENDVAVAIVRGEDFPLGPGVKRVMITEEYPHNITFAFVAGWGLIKEGSEETSIVLKHVKQMIRSNETCSLIGKLHDGMFCAGSTELDKDHPARGDSGSALVTKSKYHQIGLVSFCIRKFPALMVYTNASYYYDWIVENSRDLFCSFDGDVEDIELTTRTLST